MSIHFVFLMLFWQESLTAFSHSDFFSVKLNSCDDEIGLQLYSKDTHNLAQQQQKQVQDVNKDEDMKEIEQKFVL